MKVKFCAVIILTLLVSSVVLNTVILDRQISCLYEKSKNLNEENISEEKVDDLLHDFRKKEKFMGITVSHYDLTNIGECLVEMKACISQDDYTNAIIAKNRLEYFLEHLRRLSGFNIGAII